MRPRKIRLRKPDTQPLPLLTQELTLPTGDYLVTWSTVPHPELMEPWLNDTAQQNSVWTNDTRPVPTEPMQQLHDEPDIQYRKRCNCGLIDGEWCNCVG